MVDTPPYTRAQLKQDTANNILQDALSNKSPPYTPEQLKQADERIGVIQLLSGRTADDEEFYAYVSFRPSMYEEFCRKVNAGERLDVEKFGKVLKKGFGKEPTDEVKQYMEQKFGIDHEFLKHFAEEIEKRLKEDKK